MNPKKGLKPLADLYEPSTRGAFEASGARSIDDQLIELFERLRTQNSITTVEEVVALAHVDSIRGTQLLKTFGIPLSAIDLLREHTSAEATEAWPLLDKMFYETGSEIDFGAPAPATQHPRPVAPPVECSLMSVLPPIRDQGGRATCMSFAAVACLEVHLRKKNTVTDLSEQFHYWTMVTQHQRHTVSAAMEVLKTPGVCPAQTWPYSGLVITNNDTHHPPPGNADIQAQWYRCEETTVLPRRSVSALQSEIANGRVVAVSIPVFKSWLLHPVVRALGTIFLPPPGEHAESVGHAVALVGYAQDESSAGGGHFIVRNSWGNRWAASGVYGVGYGTLPYAYIEEHVWDARSIRK